MPSYDQNPPIFFDSGLTYDADPVPAPALRKTRDDRDASKETAVVKANTFASHAEAVTGADVAKLHAACFEIAGALGFKPAAAAAQALNLVLTIGDNDGELDAHWDAVPNARLYQLQTSTNPTDATLWKEYGVPQSRSSLVLSGLQSGVKIWVRVRSLGAGEHPAGPWSDPAVRSVP